ncbi:ParA family protein [Microtetraspora fusca]|uniref:ParA family protein n=1 Tax=Microtetraspora fusca TaxID=1997 RepID=A0ABW6VED8_MICFU
MRTTPANGLTTQQILQMIRPRLRRVIIVLNNKGGAGKTTTVANFACTVAAALKKSGSKKRILAMDLDPQGNLGLDLGYQGSEGDDKGASILQVIDGVGNLNVIRDVRPNLDVIPGGRLLKPIAIRMYAAAQADPRREVRLALAQAIAEIAGDYEWIIIDCPPNVAELQDLAAIIGRYVLIPVTFDEGSIQGMQGVGEVFDKAADLNDELIPLAALLFGFDRQNNFRKIRDESGEVVGVREIGLLASTRAEVQSLLADLEIPVLETVVTRAVNVAKHCRKRGLSYAELADATASENWREVAKQSGIANISADSAEVSAYEMEQVAAEVIRLVMKQEAAA